MKTRFFYKLLPYALIMFSGISLAALPITITYNSGTTNFASNASGTAHYVVSIGSIIPSNTPITFNINPNGSNGLTATQISTGGSLCSGVNTVCSNTTFSLSAHQSCCLEFALTSNRTGSHSLQPIISSIPTAYRYTTPSPTSINVSEAMNNTPLTITPSTLALSVDCSSAGGGCVYANAALTGTPKEFKITNTSTTATTTSLKITPAGFPTGTDITTDNCTGMSLAPLGSCSITITPGQVATSACTSGIAPTPGTVTVNAASGPSAIRSDVVVLSYGCIYQGGFIYSIDDTTTTGGIAGKTAAVYDTYTGGFIPGDPNWGGGIDVGSSTWDTDSLGANNGGAVPGYIGNTATITDALGCTPSTSPSYAACLCTNLSIDAAGSPCTSPGLCYTNWYLPAICELAPFGSICTAGSTNIQEQLYNADPAITANFVNGGFYWGSTEFTAEPTNMAWYQNFVSSGSSQGAETKDFAFSVRCSRAF